MGDGGMDELASIHGLDREGAYALVHEDVPSRRPAHAEEIASAISFLVGDGATYVNGVTLFVDGGASIYDPTSVKYNKARWPAAGGG